MPLPRSYFCCLTLLSSVLVWAPCGGAIQPQTRLLYNMDESMTQKRRLLLQSDILRQHSNRDQSDQGFSDAAEYGQVVEQLTELAALSPDPEVAMEYVRGMAQLHADSLTDYDQDMLHLDAVEDLGNVRVAFNATKAGSRPSIPVVTHAFIDELKFYSAVSAAAYCAKTSIFPRWKCGYPQCSARDTLQYPDAAPAGADVLAAVETVAYLAGTKEHMVGYVAVNEAIDLYSPSSTYGPLADLTKRTVIISFRGSLHWKNFYNDVRAAQVAFQYPDAPHGSLIHVGFWDTWRDVEEQTLAGVRDAVKLSLDKRPAPTEKCHIEIAIAGHSLGGAVGVFAGLALRRLAVEGHAAAFGLEPCHDCLAASRQEESRLGLYRFRNVVLSFKVYTYGQPRLGNELFADWVMNLAGFPIHRTTYFDDLIPHLPPRTLSFGKPYRFRHHAAEYHIKQWMKSTLACDDGRQPPKFRDQSKAQFDQQQESTDNQRGEDPACSAGVRFLNILSHLTYWNIVYGPWC